MVQIRPRPPAMLLSCGALVLDTGARTLTGPTGTVELLVGPFVILRRMMASPGLVVEAGELVAACWPDATIEPDRAEHAMRERVRQAREAIRSVGAAGDLLRTVYSVGYRLDGAPRVVRAFTATQAEALDRLLATHPDPALAALVAA